MSFQDDLNDDFANILAGEFSVRIIFFVKHNGDQITVDTHGIYDRTSVQVETTEGGYISTWVPRVAVFWKDFPEYLPEQFDRVEIFEEDGGSSPTKTFKVKDFKKDSEGNALALLKI